MSFRTCDQSKAVNSAAEANLGTLPFKSIVNAAPTGVSDLLDTAKYQTAYMIYLLIKSRSDAFDRSL